MIISGRWQKQEQNEVNFYLLLWGMVHFSPLILTVSISCFLLHGRGGNTVACVFWRLWGIYSFCFGFWVVMLRLVVCVCADMDPLWAEHVAAPSECRVWKPQLLHDEHKTMPDLFLVNISRPAHIYPNLIYNVFEPQFYYQLCFLQPIHS